MCYNKITLVRSEGVAIVELAAIAAKQAMFQQQMSLAMVKNNAQAQQAVAQMIAETVNATGTGQIVNIQV